MTRTPPPLRTKTESEPLVREIARVLNGCSGDFENLRHNSAGFHRKIAQCLGPALVKEALRAPQDAAYEAKTGGKALGSPDRYFAGIVRRIAEREGIDLGINWRR